ncbi:serine/threonine-protein kinase [Curtobacterium flaccumfaciens]|nr:serine/threonine-protein kinase [Curtobacterium flaccumfaciens]
MTLLDSARADTVLAARYRLVKLIGTGGMGSVYEARDEHTYRAVAVKLFATPDKMTTADRVRQEREIRLLSMLSHPGLIPLYDAGTHEFEDGPHRFIVMELIADTTLLRRLSEGALHNYEVADLGAQLADALAYVHSRGIVHRDVKPANILISDEGSSGFARTVKLTDFGVAHFVDGSRLTNDGTVIGTAAYLSPEQVAGEPISFATDVYSLGLVLLEALTGKQEYSGTLIEAALALAPPRPRSAGRRRRRVARAAQPDDRPRPRAPAHSGRDRQRAARWVHPDHRPRAARPGAREAPARPPHAPRCPPPRPARHVLGGPPVAATERPGGVLRSVRRHRGLRGRLRRGRPALTHPRIRTPEPGDRCAADSGTLARWKA